MDLLSLILIVILYGIVATLGVYILASMFLNMKHARGYFEKLAQKLRGLRLHKMLSALGIDTVNYLATQNKLDIEQQMKACSDCKNTEKCDQHLADGDISPDAITFCDNEKDLQDILLNKSPK